MKVDPGKAKWLPIDNEVFRVLTAMPDDGPLGRVLRKLACPLYGRKDVYELDAFEQEYYERACSTLNERLEKLGNSISNLPQNKKGKKGGRPKKNNEGTGSAGQETTPSLVSKEIPETNIYQQIIDKNAKRD